MAQLRGRTQKDRARKVHRDTDPRGSIDPIFDGIIEGDWDDNPAFLAALIAIEEMRGWGVDVTQDIARKCLLTHMQRHKEQADYQAGQDQHLQARRHPPIVYYMRLGPLVKIGFTTNLTTRLEVIHPEEVMVTEPGGRDRERERHQQFAALHAHGEWFRLEAPLTDHINAVRREAAGK